MYLIDYYGGPEAGTERQLLQLIQRCDRSRYEPAVTLLRGSDYIQQNPFDCPTRILGLVKLASVRSIFKFARFALGLRREGYRLVHCFLNDVSLIAPPLMRLCGIRVLVSRRDMGFWYTPSKLAVLRVISAFVDRYVVNCLAVAEVVQRREWVPRRKISIIYNGSDASGIGHRAGVSPIAIPLLPDAGPVVGIVANLKPIKRIDVLIRAICVVRERVPGVRLMIVGKDSPSQRGPSMRAELEELAAVLGLRETILFAGGVDEPMPYVRRFTVAVLCSESEGFSNALIEYMQAGRPVVCTDTGGNPELVQDGVNGFLVPVGDVCELADRIIKVLSDSCLAGKLGHAARETVRAFSHTRMLEEQMACYDEILSTWRSNWGFKATSGATE
jgi:glycosyltransferase involved in cell wall biosynthesis